MPSLEDMTGSLLTFIIQPITIKSNLGKEVCQKAVNACRLKWGVFVHRSEIKKFLGSKKQTFSSCNFVHLKRKIIKSSLYSWYYTEAYNEWRVHLHGLEFGQHSSEEGAEPLATLCQFDRLGNPKPNYYLPQ